AFLSPANGGDSSGMVGDVATTGVRGNGSVSVMPGDTLWDIAMRHKHADVAVDQMMVAIYRGNPGAFGDDISRLRVGGTLRMPTPAQVRAVAPEQARAQVDTARRQWLERIARITMAGMPRMGAGTDAVASGGRLRLVVPQRFPTPGGAVPGG